MPTVGSAEHKFQNGLAFLEDAVPLRWPPANYRSFSSTPSKDSDRGTSGIIVLRAFGEVDLQTVSILRNALNPASEGPHHVVVDLASVKYIDSSGVRELIIHQRLCNEKIDTLSLSIHVWEYGASLTSSMSIGSLPFFHRCPQRSNG